MKTHKLFDLPIPQSGCGNTQLLSDGISAIIKFEYRKDAKDLIGSIKFEGVIAYRFRDEFHSVGYCSEAYESVAEIEESDWIAQLKGEGRHFVVFLSSNGYFEVLATDVCIGVPFEGFLD